MNVLVIGNGGREHAILLALKKSKRVEKLYCMKGNAGTAQIAENVDVDYMNIPAVVEYAKAHSEIDYYVVAPDDPLAIGLVDALPPPNLKFSKITKRPSPTCAKRARP